MYKVFIAVLLVIVASVAFGQEEFDPTGGSTVTRYKAGDRLPDGRLVGTPEGEKPVTQADLKAKLMQARIAAEMAVEATRKGDTAKAAQLETIVVNNTTIVRESLTPSQFAALQAQVNSGPATWGKKDYDMMLNAGLIVGRELGNGSNSNEPQSHATREELVTVGRRVYTETTSYCNERVNAHDDSPYVHAPLVAKERKYVDEKSKWGYWAFWGLIGLVALWLLVSAIRAIICAITRPMPVYNPAPAPAAPAPAPAIPAGGMVQPVAYVPFNRGAGQTVIPG